MSQNSRRFLIIESMKLLSMSFKINLQGELLKRRNSIFYRDNKKVLFFILPDKPCVCFSWKQMYGFRILYSELLVVISRLLLWEDKADILWLNFLRVEICYTVPSFYPIRFCYSKNRGKVNIFFKRKKIHFREGVSPWVFLYISDGGENLKYERFVRLTAETWILWYVHGVSDISITLTDLNFIDYFLDTQTNSPHNLHARVTLKR